jgi:hypothetical protein
MGNRNNLITQWGGMRWRGKVFLIPRGDLRAELELHFDAQIGARALAVKIVPTPHQFPKPTLLTQLKI